MAVTKAVCSPLETCYSCQQCCESGSGIRCFFDPGIRIREKFFSGSQIPDTTNNFSRKKWLNSLPFVWFCFFTCFMATKMSTNSFPSSLHFILILIPWANFDFLLCSWLFLANSLFLSNACTSTGTQLLLNFFVHLANSCAIWCSLSHPCIRCCSYRLVAEYCAIFTSLSCCFCS